MFRHMLVPLDGSSRAEQALPVAAHLARVSGGVVTLLHVVIPRMSMYPHSVQLTKPLVLSQEEDVARANDYLTQVTSSAHLKGIALQTEALTGVPAATILLFAQLQHVDLIVMTSHGFTGFTRWRLGSVARQVARHSSAPVFVLREGGRLPLDRSGKTPRPLRILAALDGSPLAETVLIPATQLCAALVAAGQGTLHLVRVPPPLPERAGEEYGGSVRTYDQVVAEAEVYLQAVVERLQKSELVQPDVTITSSVAIDTDVANTIISIAEQGDLAENNASDIIAMATHGRSGPQRWFMGSITERVLGATNLPMLIVRSQQPPV